MQTRDLEDLIREDVTTEGANVKEYGPFDYGYSMTVDPDGKPKVREFGNVKSPLRGRAFLEQHQRYPQNENL